MATAERAISLAKRTPAERIVGFSANELRAPFLLRAAALFIDYLLLLIVPILWLVASGFLTDSGSRTLGPGVWLVALLVFILDFLVLPMFTGRTLGKALLGLTIVRLDGTRMDVSTVLRRNLLGYLLTAATLGLGFLVVAINRSGRALHDLVGGTIVVRARRTLNG